MALRLLLLWILVFLWICPVFPQENTKLEKLQKCFKSQKKKLNIVIDDRSNTVLSDQNFPTPGLGNDACIIFLQNSESQNSYFWPQVRNQSGSVLLRLSNFYINKEARLLLLRGERCNDSLSSFVKNLNKQTGSVDISSQLSGSCQMFYVNAKRACTTSTYDEENCSKIEGWRLRNRYIVDMGKETCYWCTKPNKPEQTLPLDTGPIHGDTLDSAQANEVMSRMFSVACSINVSAVALSLGDQAEGILVRESEDEDDISIGYSLNEQMSFTSNQADALNFQTSLTIPTEAFKQARSQNVSVPFVAFLRFPNLARDEMNSILIGDVFAVEMGATINNLSEAINLNFKKLEYSGIPSCRSWNGQGARPNWTDEGCETHHDGGNITCSCTHLTFFAILLAPPNVTISAFDLKHLTHISKGGCAVSVTFLCVVLFMHHLLRKTKASTATQLLIQLIYAMLLLNVTFLVNEFVAQLKSPAGCAAMAAAMHWSMLSTFTWFAVQALHLCLQLFVGGQPVIRRYLLKLSLASWVLPGIPVVVLLSTGKYGEQVIPTSGATEDASLCWITDSAAHYVVNMGYYALVFTVTFTTFVVVLTFLCHFRGAKAGGERAHTTSQRVTSVLGMCCILGITWGFAFFAHGALRIPSYYIFTILNSFQGFLIFIYYYKTRHSEEAGRDTSPSSVSTLQTDEDGVHNPYGNLPQKRS